MKLPVPDIFNVETIAVYYVDQNGNKTKLDSKVENGFVIFETDHFSEYVIVDESSKIEEPSVPEEPTEPDTPDEPEDTEDGCSCKCHNNFMTKILNKILNFFRKLFGGSPCCEC